MRVGRFWTAASAALLVVGAVASCSGGGGGDKSANDGGESSPGADLTNAEVTDPIQVSYVHVADSGKTDPGFDQLRLVFEPNGAMFLLAISGESVTSSHGTYERAGKKLTLAVHSDELGVAVDAEFDLDLNKAKVTMPFQVGSTAKGSSTWERDPLDVMVGTLMVMDGSRYDEKGVARDVAVKTAQEYAKARIKVDGGSGGSGGSSAPPIGRSDGMQLISSTQASNANPIVDTLPYSNGVTLKFKDGSTADVLLYSNLPGTGAALSLRPGPIASDPRVHLPTKLPGVASADPKSKVAVLVNPFLTEFGEKAAVDEAVTDLKGVGYTVQQISGTAATFEKITEALSGAAGGKPGFVTISSHGAPNGLFSTGELLGTMKDLKPGAETSLIPIMKAAAARIEKAYPGARQYKVNGVVAQPFTLAGFGNPVTGYKGYVGLSGSYFSWLLDTQKADFGDAFFFLSTCEGDKTVPAAAGEPAIVPMREKVKAKVFLGFEEQVSFSAATGAFGYLVKQLVRPTRSAEEAYYNLVRVVNTKQMIYAEDKLLDGISNQPALSEVLNAYGRSPEVQYFGAGFLDGATINPGQVWWLVFSGRWSGDAAEGASKLLNCWDGFWSKGNKGGLASPACNASNSGNLPKVDEVSYAIYLLTGTKVLGYGGTTVPRWTLADGRTP
jgi:hypothetical protein